MALRDEIKEVQDIGKEPLTMPEWNNVVIEVRGITARKRAYMLQNCVDEKGKIIQTAFQKQLVVHCSYDPGTGEQLFKEDDDWLMEKASTAIERICSVAMRLSGLGKAIEATIEKN